MKGARAARRLQHTDSIFFHILSWVVPFAGRTKVHTNVEMEIALKAGARVIGVNNRNLHTFDLDLTTTERVSQIAEDLGVPWIDTGGEGEKERIVLSALSGITGPADVQRWVSCAYAPYIF